MIDLQLLALLLIPLTGGLLLAAFGSRSWAAELNSLMSFCTFIAAVVLAMRKSLSTRNFSSTSSTYSWSR